MPVGWLLVNVTGRLARGGLLCALHSLVPFPEMTLLDVELDVAVFLSQNGNTALGAKPFHKSLKTSNSIVDLAYCSCGHATSIAAMVRPRTLPNHDYFLTRFFRLEAGVDSLMT